MRPGPDLFHRDLTPASVLAALGHGEHQGQTARRLVEAITGRQRPADERRLRSLIETLRRHGHPVCAHPSQGYYLAHTDAELDRTCEYLYARAMTSLVQISAMRRTTLPDLRGQLRLPGDR